MSNRTIYDSIVVDPDMCDLSEFIARMVAAEETVREREGTFESLFCQNDEVIVRFTRQETDAEVKERADRDKRMEDIKAQHTANREKASMSLLRRQASLKGFKLVRK